MLIRNRPIFTDIFDALEDFKPDANSSYIFGSSPEERSEHSSQWEQSCVGVNFVSLTDQGSESFSYQQGGTLQSVRLRSSRDQQDFWRCLSHRKIYLDITALEHQVWAALLKSALAAGLRTFVLYSEPGAYTFSRSPREGDIFDLSERITGLAPLPGFASLSEARQEDEVTFVALLGFEGIRLKYCVEQVQPPRNRIVPIIGVPGCSDSQGSRPASRYTQPQTLRVARCGVGEVLTPTMRVAHEWVPPGLPTHLIEERSQPCEPHSPSHPLLSSP
jgi:hypothetical protein